MDEAPAEMRAMLQENLEKHLASMAPPSIEKFHAISPNTGLSGLPYLWAGWGENMRLPLVHFSHFNTY
jgi:hypothetical protein